MGWWLLEEGSLVCREVGFRKERVGDRCPQALT